MYQFKIECNIASFNFKTIQNSNLLQLLSQKMYFLKKLFSEKMDFRIFQNGHIGHSENDLQYIK